MLMLLFGFQIVLNFCFIILIISNDHEIRSVRDTFAIFLADQAVLNSEFDRQIHNIKVSLGCHASSINLLRSKVYGKKSK